MRLKVKGMDMAVKVFFFPSLVNLAGDLKARLKARGRFIKSLFFLKLHSFYSPHTTIQLLTLFTLVKY